MAGNPLPSTSCVDPTSPLYGRTETVVGAIIDKIPGVTACDQVTTNHLASITELNFYNIQTLTSLQTKDFAGLSGLEHLRIYYSGLSSLPGAGVFGGLTNLKTLEIFWGSSSQEKLSSLPAGIFDDLTSLERLSLPYHRLTTLPAGIFDKLVNLNSLSLSDNQLTNLPAGIFDKNTKLNYHLDLSHNRLTSLPEGIFDHLNVQTLWLQGNPLDSLSCADPASPLYGRTQPVVDAILNNIPGVISCDQVTTNHLDSIDHLAIYGHGSRLTALKSGDFEGLTNLRSLSLYDNRIHTLPAGIFDKLANLETLWLYNNQLTNLPAGIFAPLTSLKRLEIHGNRLTSLPAGIFAQLSQLKHLHLENNQLTSLPVGIFEGLANLALESLHLDNNRLTALPARVFENLPNLRTLILNNNPLHEVSIPVARLQRLETFRRDGGLQVVVTGQEVIPPAPPANVLRSRSSQVAAVILDALGSDFTAANQVTNLAQLSSVTNLNLAGQSLISLQTNDFTGLASLRTLNLASNQLVSLPAGVFDALVNLETLDLSRNQISALPVGVFDELASLRTLSLANNQLASLPAGMFDALVNLVSEVELAGNPLSNEEREGDLPTNPLSPPESGRGQHVHRPIPAEFSLPSLVFSADRLTISEGETAIYQVRGTTLLSSDMIVRLQTSHPQLTIEPQTLVFASTNWMNFQAIQVRASDAAADHSEQAYITHSIDAGQFFLADDNAGIVSITLAHTIVEEPDGEDMIDPEPVDPEPEPPTNSEPTDYDLDDDGLIDISNLAQLNAIRWDLNGDGQPDKEDYKDAYTQAFPSAIANMGIPANTKGKGYELTTDLNFDTMIKHNTRRVSKQIRASENSGEAEIRIEKTSNFAEALEYVHDLYKTCVVQGESPSRVALIGRKKSQIIPYQVYFASKNIPFYAAEDLQVFLSGTFDRLLDLLRIKTRDDTTQSQKQVVSDLLKLCDLVKRFPLSKKDKMSLTRHIQRAHPTTMSDGINALSSYRGALKGSRAC